PRTSTLRTVAAGTTSRRASSTAWAARRWPAPTEADRTRIRGVVLMSVTPPRQSALAGKTFDLLYSKLISRVSVLLGRLPDGESNTMSIASRLCFSALGLILLAMLEAAAAEAPGKLTAEKVRQLQAKYQEERAAADKEGLTKQFSPEWYEQAAKLAKQGEEALEAGRLVEARASFRRARWERPVMPPHLPPHVAAIFRDARR